MVGVAWIEGSFVMGSTRRSFTQEYKQQAVAFVLDEGRVMAEVARNIGCSETLLGKWVNKERQERESAQVRVDEPLTESERAELAPAARAGP
ncbi:MAG: transposase [Actinomycetales bacterium]